MCVYIYIDNKKQVNGRLRCAQSFDAIVGFVAA